MFPVQFCTQSATATSSLCFTILSFTWMSRMSKFMLSWRRKRKQFDYYYLQSALKPLVEPLKKSSSDESKVKCKKIT